MCSRSETPRSGSPTSPDSHAERSQAGMYGGAAIVAGDAQRGDQEASGHSRGNSSGSVPSGFPGATAGAQISGIVRGRGS